VSDQGAEPVPGAANQRRQDTVPSHGSPGDTALPHSTLPLACCPRRPLGTEQKPHLSQTRGRAGLWQGLQSGRLGGVSSVSFTRTRGLCERKAGTGSSGPDDRLTATHCHQQVHPPEAGDPCLSSPPALSGSNEPGSRSPQGLCTVFRSLGSLSAFAAHGPS
jgi:hypothetical protein